MLNYQFRNNIETSVIRSILTRLMA